MTERLHTHAAERCDPLALSRHRPDWSARVPLTWVQQVVFAGGCLAMLAACWRYPWPVARGFVLICTVFYLFFTLYKLLLMRASVTDESQISVSRDEIDAMGSDSLPVYSILVPMYREAETLPYLVEALRRMDYPPERMDVQLLLEQDDDETRAALSGVRLPPGFRVTLVAPSFPRTKPKACNIGLAQARGEFLVIYDAEDRPEPDQLKKAVAAFRRAGQNVACLQSKLNFYNPRFNLLTRWFTAEYSAWFDLNLPGLCSLGAVIPLGGTSNHFRTELLRRLYGWDAFNVTEDCDLGVRIYRQGYCSRMLNTTTWEEACSDWGFWVKQRTRWLKGYIQTYLVHMRHPSRLWRDLGGWNFMHFQLLIGGIVFSFLVNPLFWAMAGLWFFLRLELLASLFPGLVFMMGAVCLFAGNFMFAYAAAVGCYRRQYYDLVKYAMLVPVYWVFMSYSGWRAFFQFFSNPFYWEKTKHGLSGT